MFDPAVTSSRPLQNRVTPTGEIVSHPARGSMMGNRGCLHQADRRLGTSRWRSKMWICCVLAWKGVRRDPMPPDDGPRCSSWTRPLRSLPDTAPAHTAAARNTTPSRRLGVTPKDQVSGLALSRSTLGFTESESIHAPVASSPTRCPPAGYPAVSWSGTAASPGFSSADPYCAGRSTDTEHR
jgi:hypothetical protein